MTKTEQRRLLGMVKRVLTHRRNGHIRYEQAAYERLHAACVSLGVDVADAIDQGIAFLRKHSIAASMNGLV